jgi:glycosyltransferase involved in cell wall biosynthesis
MRIVHINTFESRGGAARAANRLHRGLRAQGLDSSMFVAQRDTGDQDVVMFQSPNDLTVRLRRAARRRYLQWDLARIASAQRSGAEIFTDDRTPHGAEPLRQLPQGDIFHLHWVAGFVDYKLFLPGAARSAPLVWTLHDMNPFTGGCHYDASCGRYAFRCGVCPQLESEEETDLSNEIWRRKRDAYSSISPGRLHVITPSQWLASEAKRSALFNGFPVSVIPYGLDVTTFSPRNRTFAREFFGIPNDRLVILCIADRLDNRRKGLGPLREALAGLKDHPDFLLATIGQGDALQDSGMPHASLGYMNDDRLVSLAYSTADVFVCPSSQDNLPNTILESMACAVPVVSFSVGGVPEMVREGITGNLVPAGDIQGLREAIVGILRDRARRVAMAANCRQVAVGEYSLEIQAKRYISLYETILASN